MNIIIACFITVHIGAQEQLVNVPQISRVADNVIAMVGGELMHVTEKYSEIKDKIQQCSAH